MCKTVYAAKSCGGISLPAGHHGLRLIAMHFANRAQDVAFGCRFSAEEAPGSRLGEQDSPREARRLLIVEDEADIAASLCLLLSHGMVRIEVAANGLDAIAKARMFAPHAILLDVRLPGMDGFEVYRTLRAELAARGTKVIFLS